MAKSKEIRVAPDQITVRRGVTASIAVVGNPNSGKSTLFNRLTGLKQRIGNYPGVTVERHVGISRHENTQTQLVDLPGTHSLSPHSLEEQIAVDVILGRMQDTDAPEGILAVVDASNLYQGLFLLQQLIALQMPIIVALTMNDAAVQSGIQVDANALSEALGGVKVCSVVATTGKGINELRAALAAISEQAPSVALPVWPELRSAASELQAATDGDLRLVEAERLLVDGVTERNQSFAADLGEDALRQLDELQARLFAGEPPLAVEARIRYGWIKDTLHHVQSSAPVVAGCVVASLELLISR